MDAVMSFPRSRLEPEHQGRPGKVAGPEPAEEKTPAVKEEGSGRNAPVPDSQCDVFTVLRQTHLVAIVRSR